MKNSMFLYFISCLCCYAYSQNNSITLNLNDVLTEALESAPELELQDHILRLNQLDLQLFNEELKPTFYLNGAFPILSRSIESRPLPDGRDAFVNRSTMYNRLGLNFEYILPGTGGSIFAESRIERLDILKTQTLPYSRNYFLTPIRIGYNQSLFQFNEIRWDKEQNNLLNTKLKYEKAKIREDIITQIVQIYCDGLNVQHNLDLLHNSIQKNDSLYTINNRLYDLGLKGKIELMRLDLEKKKNLELFAELKQNFIDVLIQLSKYSTTLQSGINIDQIRLETLTLPIPNELIRLQVLQAYKNNDYVKQDNHLKVRIQETEIERVSKNRDINFSINVSAGANNTGNTIQNLVTGMQDQENLGISLSLPLNNGKERTIRQEIALNQLLQLKSEIANNTADDERTLKALVNLFQYLKNNISSIAEQVQISNEIYNLSIQEYMNGNIILSELFDARRNYENAEATKTNLELELVKTYFNIRSICLYDFETNSSLVNT